MNGSAIGAKSNGAGRLNYHNVRRGRQRPLELSRLGFRGSDNVLIQVGQ
jgi:hypothetical protein